MAREHKKPLRLKDPKTGKFLYSTENLVEIINKYVDNCKRLFPQPEDFFYKHGISKSYFYRIKRNDPEVAEAWERLTNRQISLLAFKGAKGEIDKTMAIFLLKNLGFTDAPQQKEEKAPVINLIVPGLEDEGKKSDEHRTKKSNNSKI